MTPFTWRTGFAAIACNTGTALFAAGPIAPSASAQARTTLTFSPDCPAAAVSAGTAGAAFGPIAVSASAAAMRTTQSESFRRAASASVAGAAAAPMFRSSRVASPRTTGSGSERAFVAPARSVGTTGGFTFAALAQPAAPTWARTMLSTPST